MNPYTTIDAISTALAELTALRPKDLEHSAMLGVQEANLASLITEARELPEDAVDEHCGLVKMISDTQSIIATYNASSRRVLEDATKAYDARAGIVMETLVTSCVSGPKDVVAQSFTVLREEFSLTEDIITIKIQQATVTHQNMESAVKITQMKHRPFVRTPAQSVLSRQNGKIIKTPLESDQAVMVIGLPMTIAPKPSTPRPPPSQKTQVTRAPCWRRE